MKKLIWVVLALGWTGTVMAQWDVNRHGWSADRTQEIVADGFYFFPSQQNSGFYSNGGGAEIQYRFFFWRDLGVGASLGWNALSVEKERPNLVDPAQATFSGHVNTVPLGLSAYWRMVDYNGWRLTFEIGGRYLFVQSDAKMNWASGRAEEVQMDNALAAVLMLDLDYFFTESFGVFVGGGVQLDVAPGDISVESGDAYLFNNNFKGYPLRLGAKFIF